MIDIMIIVIIRHSGKDTYSKLINLDCKGHLQTNNSHLGPTQVFPTCLSQSEFPIALYS